MKRSDVFRKICTNYYGMSETETENWVKRLFKNPQEKEDSVMPKCPWCGSTAQVTEQVKEYRKIDEQTLYIDHYCVCGCGTAFVAKEKIMTLGYEEVEPVMVEEIQRKLLRRG